MKQAAGKTVKSWQDLRGLSHQQQGKRQRGFKGSKVGPASPGRRLSAAEREAIEVRMKAEGTL